MRHLLFATLAAATVLAPSALAAQSTTYTDPQGRFTVEIPRGWSTTLMGTHGVMLSSTGVSVVINPFAPFTGTDTPDAVVQMVARQMLAQWKGVHQVGRQETTFQGWPAAWAAYTGDDPKGEPGAFRLVGVKGDGLMVAIIVSTVDPATTTARPAIDLVFQSLRLRGSAAAAEPTPSSNRAIIGMAARTINDDDVRQLHLTTRDGVLVIQLRPGSPAERAGVQTGDELVAIDRAPVRSQEEYIRLLGQHQPGDVVELTLIRNGRSGTIRVQMVAP